MNKRLIAVFVLSVLMISLFTGCGAKNSQQNNSSHSQAVKGDPLVVISTAVKNLNSSTDFNATKTLLIKINGKETRTVVFDLLTNSSNLFAVSKTELKNGSSKTIFKRVHLKNV